MVKFWFKLLNFQEFLKQVLFSEKIYPHQFWRSHWACCPRRRRLGCCCCLRCPFHPWNHTAFSSQGSFGVGFRLPGVGWRGIQLRAALAHGTRATHGQKDFVLVSLFRGFYSHHPAGGAGIWTRGCGRRSTQSDVREFRLRFAKWSAENNLVKPSRGRSCKIPFSPNSSIFRWIRWTLFLTLVRENKPSKRYVRL